MRKLILPILCFIFAACSSTAGFEGNGDLCGLIVDDLNQPISDFMVSCSNGKKTVSSTYTNESGIFVFYNLPSGNYSISGEKNNYLKLKNAEYSFMERGKIFCGQTLELDSALDKVEKLILLEEYKDAEEIISSISVKKDSSEAAVVIAYKDFLDTRLKEDEQNESEQNNS